MNSQTPPLPAAAALAPRVPSWRVPGRLVYVICSHDGSAASIAKSDAHQMARALQGRGSSVVIIDQCPGAETAWREVEGIRYIYPQAHRPQPTGASIPGAEAAARIEEVLRIFKPLAVLAASPASTALAALGAAAALGLPLIYDPWNLDATPGEGSRAEGALLKGAAAVLLRGRLSRDKLVARGVEAGRILSAAGAAAPSLPALAEAIIEWCRHAGGPAVVSPVPSPAQPPASLPASSAGQTLRVAGVMDEFTFHSYDPECELLQLHPEHCIEQLAEFKPDLLFIESAWKGLDGLWQQKVSNNGPEISAAIAWCKQHGVPTLLWNKEDPVHFGTFVPLAKQVDYVFTTDIDCIPRYKFHVGHERVFLLPFAAQPATHNPLELYERKDAFNFAGSYYLRYPERQRDFAALIDTVRQFRPVDIYDRNYDNPHPHYTFPDHYKPMVLGKLPFAEIDRAYKGYRYGINMNTIKQSQTMFARRVFELLASNTVVVSNFSRGVRLLFGDLVVTSDNAGQLEQRLQAVCRDDSSYRKLRLLGLRKVMGEHTYAHRLRYVRSRLAGVSFETAPPPIALLGVARSAPELAQLTAAFTRQAYRNKRLLVLAEGLGGAAREAASGIELFATAAACVSAAQALPADALVGLLAPADHYAAHYLTDLQLASTYSQAEAFGKVSHYAAEGRTVQLRQPDRQYRPAAALRARAALARRSALPASWFAAALAAPEEASLACKDMLGIDEFNYIAGGAGLENAVKAEAEDLLLADQGVSFAATLAPAAESLPAAASAGGTDSAGLPQLSAEALFALLTPSASLQFSHQDDRLLVKSSLEAGKHGYAYTRKALSREELNLVLNSQFKLFCEGALEIRTVFEFQDKGGKKISHQMNAVGDKHALAIPANCTKIRFGLRIVGPGEARIDKLVLGSNAERPAAIVCRSSTLVLSKQYPAYDDLYRYGFLHSRLRAYKKAGLMVDLFRIGKEPPGYREFEGIDVASGDTDLLDATLASGQIRQVLVHLLDDRMWQVLKKYIDRIKVTVWVHGAEIQVWERRSFEFERMSEEEVARQKKLSDKRKLFWRSIMLKPHPNLHFVFVSEQFFNQACQDLGVSLPAAQVSMIHNYIDGNLFKYSEKKPDDRKKILSIRPYTSRTYANDLTAQAIVALSTRDFFSDLEFCLYGDGELFDAITAPLGKFKNVKLVRRFLSQAEIARVHGEYGVFMTPTRMDTQGVSRDEAMSSGLVPVTTNVASIPEFVDATCGILVPAEDSQALADGVEFLYKNPEKFLALSQAAAERVRRQCGFGATCDREVELIRRRSI